MDHEFSSSDFERFVILIVFFSYGKAVELLEYLLEATSKSPQFCPDFRGRWWDRLALNLDSHLKLKERAFQVIESAFEDEEVRPHTLLILFERAEKLVANLTQGISGKLAHQWMKRLKELKEKAPNLVEIHEITIEGRLQTKGTVFQRFPSFCFEFRLR